MTLRTDGTACTCKSGLIIGAMSAWYARVFSCKDCNSNFGINCKVLVCMQPISEYTLYLQILILQYGIIPHSRLMHAAFDKEVASVHAIVRGSAAVRVCTAVKRAQYDMSVTRLRHCQVAGVAVQLCSSLCLCLRCLRSLA